MATRGAQRRRRCTPARSDFPRDILRGMSAATPALLAASRPTATRTRAFPTARPLHKQHRVVGSQAPPTRSTRAMAATAEPRTTTVDAAWLQANLGSVKVLDCSWYLPAMNRGMDGQKLLLLPATSAHVIN